MEHGEPPTEALTAYGPGSRLVDYGPPPGVLHGECGHAYMVDTPAPFGGQLTTQHRAFFKPSADDLERLNAGGYVVVGLVGDGIQPFFCSTFGETPDRAPVDPPIPADHHPVG